MSYYSITKREVIASIVIISIMIILGVIIGGKINDNHNDKVAIYNKALKIEDKATFEYAMSTNVGDAFIKGKLKSVDTVTFDELKEKTKYISVYKDKEIYTRHTRTVTHTNSNGNSYTTIEVYYTWDFAGRESKVAKEVKFLGINFKTEEFQLPSHSYITTIKDSWLSNTRYVYYGVKAKSYDYILFTKLKDNKINDTEFNQTDISIQELIDDLSSNVAIYVFWVLWIAFAVGLIYLFIMAENRWLE